MTSDNPWFHDSGGPPPRTGADPPDPPAAGTPLYDELASTLPVDLTTTAVNTTVDEPDDPEHAADPATIKPAVVLDLFARIKAIEESDGGWPGGDTVDVLTAWFDKFGIDVDDDPAAAGRALRLPAHLASALAAPHLRDGEFAIHLRTEHAEHADYVRSYLSALVWALGEDTSAAVFDHTGDQITHLTHPDTASR
jgi:hypothetical protein